MSDIGDVSPPEGTSGGSSESDVVAAEPDTTGASSYEDLQAIIQHEITEALQREKINNILIGWITGLDPITVKLLDNEDVQPVLKSQGMVLNINDKVGLKHSVNGWIITEQLEPVTSTTLLGMVPLNSIMIWPFSTAPPQGWFICDGTNGTPDLRNTSIIGAGTTFSFNSTGGSTTHGHTNPSTSSDTHDHANGGSTSSGGGHGHGNTNTGGVHDHGGQTGTGNQEVARATGEWVTQNTGHRHSISSHNGHVHGTDSVSGHAHTFSERTLDDQHSHTQGNTNTLNHMPPYRAYNFIQFKGV